MGGVWCAQGPRYFNPRSPCGERHLPSLRIIQGNGISIHALLAESDLREWAMMDEATVISIHALLAESDEVGAGSRSATADFNPRSPCGERP